VGVQLEAIRNPPQTCSRTPPKSAQFAWTAAI
jgi:hypothetical protein